MRHASESPRLRVDAALAAQRALAARVVREDRLGPLRHVAGVDVHYGTMRARAAAVVLSFPDLAPEDEATFEGGVPHAYVPGLFSLREAPPVLAALSRLRVRPDLVLCDGHGIAHPRRCGLASHVGVAAGLPAIGIAKTRLVGAFAPVARARGAWSPLVEDGETIGAALRTRSGVKPVFVSIGHRVGLETAIRCVLACSPRYRIAEPLRAADALARSRR